MTVEEKVRYITQRYPDFAKKTIRDEDSRGNVFYDMIIENEKNPSMPLTLSVSDEGCTISVGIIGNITGGKPISHEVALSAVDDVISGKILFVTGYRGKDTYGVDTPFMTQIFALTGREDDMTEEYESFKSTLSKPLSKFERLFTSLKGKFIITDYFGNVRLEITR